MWLSRRLTNRLKDFRGEPNTGKWDRLHMPISEPNLYGEDDTTYLMGAEFLQDVGMVEDWGCGIGGFRKFCKTPYIGVDGSRGAFIDRIADLETYGSHADGIFMRQVLEHNYRWQPILDSALASFTLKMCLVIFTPFAKAHSRDRLQS